VAILSKLESKKEPKLHLQEFKAQKGFSQKKIKPTRGILEAFLVLPNADLLSVFALHFPSQGSPTEARIQAVNRLNELVQKSSDLSIAGGDFNITKSEEKKHKIFKNRLSKNWLVSHLIGCKKCKGSHYYHRKRSWSFLDALLFSKSFKSSSWKIDVDSIDVYNELSVQSNRYGSPARFNMGKDSFGVSDHWPVVAEIYLNE
jgi:endonuclease/exonuclease/phosphatase family metal-dependent hydrolase